MQEGSVPSYEDRVPLFPGGSCFPLSGDSNPKASERLDQLSVIFGVIGTPAKEDIESIGSADQYIKTLKKSPSKSIEDIYPAADAQAIDLLKKMLQFNPSKRCTADEALNHAFLEDVRQVEKEKKVHRALIGPDFLNSDKISIEEIKKRIREEVLWFKEKEAN
jgi:mitogen-activated protein kinase 1/3